MKIYIPPIKISTQKMFTAPGATRAHTQAKKKKNIGTKQPTETLLDGIYAHTVAIKGQGKPTVMISQDGTHINMFIKTTTTCIATKQR